MSPYEGAFDHGKNSEKRISAGKYRLVVNEGTSATFGRCAFLFVINGNITSTALSLLVTTYGPNTNNTNRTMVGEILTSSNITYSIATEDDGFTGLYFDISGNPYCEYGIFTLVGTVMPTVELVEE